MVSTEPAAPAWNESLLKNPHAVADKRARVRQMFAAIAPSYDLNNRLHSLGIDQLWRRKAVKLATVSPADRVLDVACGTGDLTLQFARHLLGLTQKEGRISPPPAQVIGVDFTFDMLPLARRKGDAGTFGTIIADPPLRPNGWTTWVNGDAQALPVPDESADVVSIAFGIRNVADPGAAVQEFYRVLRPAGRVIILEFSLPTNPLLRALYNFYFRQILPRTATLISGDKTGAYRYLPESVNTFIGREQMIGMMRDAGFINVEQHAMTFGVCVCYRGCKPL